MPETAADISFPVPYPEQAKFLKLADDFLALNDVPQDQNHVISIDTGRRVKPTAKYKKLA